MDAIDKIAKDMNEFMVKYPFLQTKRPSNRYQLRKKNVAKQIE